MATVCPVFPLFPPFMSLIPLLLFSWGLSSVMCPVKLSHPGLSVTRGECRLKVTRQWTRCGSSLSVVSLSSPGGRPRGRGGLRGEGHPEQPVPPERGVLGPQLPTRHDTVWGHQGRRGPGPGQRGTGDGGHPQGEAPAEDGGWRPCTSVPVSAQLVSFGDIFPSISCPPLDVRSAVAKYHCFYLLFPTLSSLDALVGRTVRIDNPAVHPRWCPSNRAAARRVAAPTFSVRDRKRAL